MQLGVKKLQQALHQCHCKRQFGALFRARRQIDAHTLPLSPLMRWALGKVGDEHVLAGEAADLVGKLQAEVVAPNPCWTEVPWVVISTGFSSQVLPRRQKV